LHTLLHHSIRSNLAVVRLTGFYIVIAAASSAQQPGIVEYPVPTPNAGLTYIVQAGDRNLWFAEMFAKNTVGIGKINTSGAVTEYPVPSPFHSPLQIVEDPDGNVWFTDGTNIGMITHSGATTKAYSLSGADLSVRIEGIASGPDGNLWFTKSTEVEDEGIGKITPAGVTTEYPIPTAVGILSPEWTATFGSGAALLLVVRCLLDHTTSLGHLGQWLI
jgi:streptogramin lyase